ncbi:immunity 52 family protein [Acinetobacter bereziniae]|uniref:immunity 52 family protein n=1 Tax=Acinetobacter bereziniae TaxID=106648 RepID=UPI000EF64ED8|nr:immunity 52 family protein [Acinetobacter bereziniae]MBJ8421198.1 immunity 52 family protein [Acinetobacter bereziniae]MBJ9905422.1 immunity 52 family protein [Acinetobacter bereziniae]MCU4321593.1 immunity 52 family protein [Acinetobacter bereziniae]MCU4475247.1 immunity 52 family protein [Acinetobacter bereziniae]MCU4540448.1 immunity 52 family protein [Acinetobacter bereziniae]
MLEKMIHTVLNKALKTSDEDIKQQLSTLKYIVKVLKNLDPLFNQWHIGNIDVDINMDAEEIEKLSPTLGYKFPSDKAELFLFKQRKEKSYATSLLWNGGSGENFASMSLSISGFELSIQKQISLDIIVKIFEIILNNFSLDYIYLTTEFIHNTLIFKHRHTVSPICYVSKNINQRDIPHLFKKIDVLNDLNQGSILIFDENIFEESDPMKKIIEENAIALVALNAIPEIGLDPEFFSDIDY